MHLKRLCLPLVFLLAQAVTTTARSEGVATAPDSVSLAEVTVTAPQKYTDLIPAQTLGGRELEGMRSHSVADALRYFSGAQLKDYGGVGGIKTIDIRSMGTNHSGIYYNGIELGNAQNGQVDLGRYSLDNIEAITLYNGQRSQIFQSAKEFGQAGSVYLQSRTPRFSPGRDVNVRVGLRGGSFETFNPSLLVECKASRTVSLSASAEWLTSSGKYRFRYKRVTPSGATAYDTTAVRQNGDIDHVRLEGGVHGALPGGRWKAFAYHYASERGIPGAIVNNVWRRGERLRDRNSFVQALAETRTTDFWRLKVSMKYAADYTHYTNDDDKLVPVDNTYRQKEFYASLANLFELAKGWEASVAYDFQWNGLTDYLTADRTTHWVSGATSINLAGRFRAQATALATIVRDLGSHARTTTRFTPGVFVSYKPFSTNLVARAFFKQSFRMPTFNDLYYTEMGNACLRPETATQWNGGLLWDASPRHAGWLRYVSLGVDGYYNYVKDKIVAYPKGQQFRWTMLNLGKVQIRGIDVHAQLTFGLPGDVEFTAKGQYTWQRAIDTTDPADSYYRHQIPYIPHHSGSAIAMIGWRGWRLNYSFVYTGERYSQQENIAYNYVQPWYTSDLSLTKSFTAGRVRLTATAELNNVFNQAYEVIANYPMPGRNWRLGLTVDL